MTTEYKHMNWVFDMDAFSEMLRDKLRKEDLHAFAQLIGVHVHTVENWRNHAHSEREFDHPRMSNLIKVCNTLDVDPRLFFGVE